MIPTFRANGGQQDASGLPTLRARKREFPVQVRFAAADATVATREGLVPAAPGDAIVTGSAGEQWPVPRAQFAQRYRPLAPLAAGQPGTYLSLPIEVLARQFDTPFAVALPDGRGQLAGQAGDWLVQYADGSLGIVAASIFSTTYDVFS